MSQGFASNEETAQMSQALTAAHLAQAWSYAAETHPEEIQQATDQNEAD